MKRMERPIEREKKYNYTKCRLFFGESSCTCDMCMRKMMGDESDAHVIINNTCILLLQTIHTTTTTTRTYHSILINVGFGWHPQFKTRQSCNSMRLVLLVVGCLCLSLTHDEWNSMITAAANAAKAKGTAEWSLLCHDIWQKIYIVM